MSFKASLFEPSGGQGIEPSISAVESLIGGEVALLLCVLAVALLGIAMLDGRLLVRRGMRVVLGCFILLGAPAMAISLVGISDNTGPLPLVVTAPQANIASLREPLPPANYDPYSGASLPKD